MGIIDRYLQRRGFIKAEDIKQKSAGFMELETASDPTNRPDQDRIADYGTFINAYRRLPWLYAGVTALAIAATKPTLRVYREIKTSSGVDQVEVTGEEINARIELPNPNMSYVELLQVTIINLALLGNQYWNLVGTQEKSPISKTNRPVEIWWVKPGQIQPKPNADGTIGFYEFTSAIGKTKQLDPSEIIHFKMVNPGSYHLGLGMMEPLMTTTTLEFNAMAFQRHFMENDGTPPFVFEHPGDPSEEQRKSFFQSWDARHKGPKKTNRPGMIWGGMKTNVIGTTMKDAQYVELRQMNRNEMLAGLGVPPSVVGLLEYANYCLPPYVRVSLSNGLHLPVAQLKEGMEVLAYDEATHRIVPRKILDIHEAGEQKIIEIKTGNRTIQASDGHKFLKLMPGLNPSRPRRRTWVRADSVQVGDYIAIQTKTISGRARTLPDGTEATADLMEQLGLFLGDGNVMRNARAQNGLCFAIPETDKNRVYYIEQAKRVWESARVYQVKRDLHVMEDKYTFRISSRRAAAQVIGWGLDARDIASKNLPDWLFDLADDLKSAFMRGIINSDGYTDKFGRITIGMKNRAIIEGLRELCLSLGWHVNNICERRGYTNFGPAELHSFVISRNGKQATGKFYRHRLGKGMAWGKVRKVEYIGRDQTYDIEVEGAHTFFAQGILTHNSNMEVQQKKFWEDTVIPMLGIIADKLTLRLAPLFDERIWFEFDYSNIKVLQEDEERRSRTASAWIQNGVKTPNQIRAEMFNDDPYEGGDQYFMTMSMLPIGTDAKAAAAKRLKAATKIKADSGEEGKPKGSFWTTPERKKVLWQAFDKRVSSQERAILPEIEKYLHGQADEVYARAVSAESVAEIKPAKLFDIEEEVKLYADKFEGRYRQAFERAGNAGYDATKGMIWAPPEERKLKDVDEFKVTPEHLAALRAQIEKAAQYFNETTWETIQVELERAGLGNLTVQETANALKDKLDGRAAYEARRIARTEMAATENWGQLEGYKQNEFVTMKGWLAQPTEDSRDGHLEADGQEVLLNEDFIVEAPDGTREALTYPGDPKASAGNRINCNCTEYPVVQ